MLSDETAPLTENPGSWSRVTAEQLTKDTKVKVTNHICHHASVLSSDVCGAIQFGV